MPYFFIIFPLIQKKIGIKKTEHGLFSAPNLVPWSLFHYQRRLGTERYRRPFPTFRAEKRSAQASAHPLSQAQGGNFLCVDCACLFLEFWVKCTRCERLLPVKHFYLTCLLFFRHLKITLDSEQPMLKEKRIIPSVWGGIKGFEHF